MALIDLLPDYYQNSVQVVDFQKAIGEVAENLIQAKDGLFDQLFVRDAEWGLSLWEKTLNIPTDLSKSYAFRRERIQSKLRWLGVSTKKMLLNAITSYPYCDAELIEDNNIYKFIIKFNNYYRVPDNDIIDELYDVIEEIKPAHLAYEHTFTYNWWGKEDNGVWNDGGTWDDLRNYTEV